MNNSQNNNTEEYIKINNIQSGDDTDIVLQPPNKDDIELIKIYMKIYVRLFLYIQFKLNKKFNKSSSSNRSTKQVSQQTLIDSMQSYKEDVAAQTDLQSVDLYFIRPLFESMCKNNYDDICIQYFNSFIKPKKEMNPDSMNDFLEQILEKYQNLAGDYENLADKENYKAIVNYVKSLDGNLNEDELVELMKKIKVAVANAKKTRNVDADTAENTN
jgi:hypothetical protein